MNSNSSDHMINRMIQCCNQCALCSRVQHKVINEGPWDARYIVCGEAPGRTEYELMRPFVGVSGNLLRNCLADAAIPSDEVFFDNAVRCWPHKGDYPGTTVNETPKYNHIMTCRSYVYMEIDFIRPKVIVAAGNVALKLFSSTERGITKCHGIPFQYKINGEEYTVVPIYHPSYIHRLKEINDTKYKAVFSEYMEDLKLVKQLVTNSDKKRKYN